MTDFAVLVVDDDFRVAELHARAVAGVPGFTVAARAGTRAAARTAVAARSGSSLRATQVSRSPGVEVPSGSSR